MVYNENHEEIKEYDLDKGCICEQVVVIHHDAKPEVEEQFHYERVVERNFTKVVDVPGEPATEEYDEEVVVKIYHPYTTEEQMRVDRAKVCFPVINRGYAWYRLLSNEQFNELTKWYKDWLDAPETGVAPETPTRINNKIEETEDIL